MKAKGRRAFDTAPVTAKEDWGFHRSGAHLLLLEKAGGKRAWKQSIHVNVSLVQKGSDCVGFVLLSIWVLR
jgi:hypothetical protein